MKQGKKQVAAKVLATSLNPHSASLSRLQNLLYQSNPLFKLRSTIKGTLTKQEILPLTPREQSQLAMKFYLKQPPQLPRGYSAHLSHQLKDPTSLMKRLQDWFRSLFSSRS